MANVIANCPLCGGKVRVESILTKKDGVDYSKYNDEHGFMTVLPPLSEFSTKYYCTCEKRCFAVTDPDLIVGEAYNTEQEAIAVWNRAAAWWNEKLKEVKQ